MDAINSKLEEVINSLDGDGNLIDNTIPLTPKDEMLIGRFLQQYCWGDFNARRAINYLRQINYSDPSNFSGKLNDAEVLTHLASESAALKKFPAVQSGLVKAAEILKMHRGLRHHFAHWASRRSKHHNVFVMITTNASEAKKKGVADLGVGTLGFAVFPVDDLECEIVNLVSHNEFLAQAVNFLGNYIKDPTSIS